MSSNTKYRVNNLAKDLDMKAKNLVDFCTKCGLEGKTATALVQPEEIALILDRLSAENQITDMTSYISGKTFVPGFEPKEVIAERAEEAKKTENANIAAEKKEEKKDL